MAFCPNCGASVEGRFCAKCGTAMAEAPSAGTTPGAGYSGAPGPGAQQSHGQPQYSAPPAGAAGLTDNVAGALCYVLGLITGIVFLVLAPYNQNKFVRFHAFQAIFLHVAFIALAVVDMIISAMLPWSLSVIASLLWMVIMLGGLVVWILVLVKAYQGQKFKLPIIGDMAEKQA